MAQDKNVLALSNDGGVHQRIARFFEGGQLVREGTCFGLRCRLNRHCGDETICYCLSGFCAPYDNAAE
uniref:Uncharacterized protein n=1 Tax=Globodera rostochiensis TaxID=31243 RepID=A0A914HQX8_GLORO